MLIFSTSDKGGTGRSVTSCNVAYRRALLGDDVAYLDFDFGSPTSGAVFDIPDAERGSSSRGLHSYLQNGGEYAELEVSRHSVRESLRDLPPRAGRLVLLPGDVGGGEFNLTPELVQRCVRLFLKLEGQSAYTFVDLSAGRSYALELALRASAHEDLRHVVCRWLVFHRWTRQHIVAAAGLVFGEQGIVATGKSLGHSEDDLRNAIRFVRTAVVDFEATHQAPPKAEQEAWLKEINRVLKDLAASRGLGLSALLGDVPLDPVLQWREQIISDADVRSSKIANQATVDAFADLALKLSDDQAWEGL